MQRIIPHLWFDDQAEEAAQFYKPLFRDSKIHQIRRYTEVGQEIHGRPPGSAMTVEFELAGYRFVGLNGGPHFDLNPAISFFVVVETRDEVQALWDGLCDGGMVMMELDAYPWSEAYGWVCDRFGVTWQVSLGKLEEVHQTISPAMLFIHDNHGKAEEALNHYVSTFPDSSVEGILRYEGTGDETEGTVQHAQFYLSGETFMVMDNAYPHGFQFNEAISFMVRCKDQAEIDAYWEALSEVPEAERCGWLKDAYGVSWQIVPTDLDKLLDDPDPEVVARVTSAFLEMKKIDIAELEKARSSSQ